MHSPLIIALLFLIFLLMAALLREAKRRPIPASSHDWYVVFDIDAESKTLTLWVYPIVAFRRESDTTVPVVSRPSFVTGLEKKRPLKQIDSSLWGSSYSYGRWVRNGATYDSSGNPESSSERDFYGVIESNLLGDFKIWYATPIPIELAEQVRLAATRVNELRNN